MADQTRAPKPHSKTGRKSAQLEANKAAAARKAAPSESTESAENGQGRDANPFLATHSSI